MELIFYFFLRRFFVRLSFTDNALYLSRGLFLRRDTVIPSGIITMVEVKRSLLHRLLRVRKITVSTLAGRAEFFLREDEPLPAPIPHVGGTALSAPLRSSFFGAFIHTKALSGVVVFSLTLSRIGNIFGSEYYDRIVRVIMNTADGLADTLSLLHVAVPRITSAAIVFTAAAWLFALAVNTLAHCRFRLRVSRGCFTVSRGIFSLYECTVVQNNINAAVICDTPATLLLRRAPLYCRGVMVFPAADRKNAERICHIVCRIPPAEEAPVKPPPKALFGHCAVPLGWAVGLSAAAMLIYADAARLIGISAALLRSFLWIGAAVSLWYCLLYGIYMRHSGICRGVSSFTLSARSGARLYTAHIPVRMAVSSAINRTPFQKLSGRCGAVLCCQGNRRFTLRHVPYPEITKFL